jgi:hypothetical protein
MIACAEVIWAADMFSDRELLTRYRMKLVRLYAAERLAPAKERKAATDAQQFLDRASTDVTPPREEGAVYRYREVKGDGTDSFALESLLPGTGYDVHLSN